MTHTYMVGTLPTGTVVRKPGSRATAAVVEHRRDYVWVESLRGGAQHQWPDDTLVEVVEEAS